MLSVLLLSVLMPSVTLLSVIMLSVIMLNDVAPLGLLHCTFVNTGSLIWAFHLQPTNSFTQLKIFLVQKKFSKFLFQRCNREY
jgi:hypothetical protein